MLYSHVTPAEKRRLFRERLASGEPVSYTHLTLPTKA